MTITFVIATLQTLERVDGGFDVVELLSNGETRVRTLEVLSASCSVNPLNFKFPF